jgi:hypothetical protein
MKFAVERQTFEDFVKKEKLFEQSEFFSFRNQKFF